MCRWWKRTVKRVKTTPPGCLSGFQTTREGAEILDGEGCWVSWSLACSCGGSIGKVLGYPLRDYNSKYDGPEVFVSPLAFQCAACGKRTEIIDTGVHGYEGEFSRMRGTLDKTTYRGSGERTVVTCPACNAAAYAVTLQFMHSHFEHIEDEPELEPRAQDFFDVFDCACKCPNCGEEWSAADYELA